MDVEPIESSTPERGRVQTCDLAPLDKPLLWPWVVFFLATCLFNASVYSILEEFSLEDSIVASVVMVLFPAVMSGEFCIAIVVCGFWGRTWLEGYAAALLLNIFGFCFIFAGKLADDWLDGIAPYISMEHLSLCDVPAIILLSSIAPLLFRVLGGWRLTHRGGSLPNSTLGITDLINATALVASLLMLGRTVLEYSEQSISEYWLGLAAPSLFFSFAGLIAIVPTVWLVFRVTQRRALKLIAMGISLAILAGCVTAVAGQLTTTSASPSFKDFILFTAGTMIAFVYLVVGLTALRITGLQLFTSKQPTATAVPRKVSRLRRYGVPAVLFTSIIALHLILSSAIAAREAWKLPLRQVQREMTARGGHIEFYHEDSEVMSIALGPSATRDELKLLYGYRSLDSLSLAGMADVADDDLLFLRTMESLTSLDLSRTSITDKGLELIAECPNVRFLRIVGTKCTAAGISNLVAHTSILSLDIGYLELDDDGIEAISSNMQSGLSYSLGLSGNPITNACFTKLHKNATIHSLDLTDCDVDEGCLLLDHYARLILDGTKITDAAFATRLQSPANGTPLTIGALSMDRTAITENVLDAFSVNPPSVLKLGDTLIPEESLSRLGLGPKEHLFLNSSKFTGACFQNWRPSIAALVMSGSGVTDAAIENIVKLPNLRNLVLKDTAVSDACLKTLAKSNLRQINLSRTRVTARGLSAQNWDKVVWISADQFEDAELTQLLDKKTFKID